MVFVPVDNANDAPKVAGTFPTSEPAAKRYIFESRQLDTGRYHGRAIRPAAKVAFIVLDFTYEVIVAAP
jgi:hypothetical protein